MCNNCYRSAKVAQILLCLNRENTMNRIQIMFTALTFGLSAISHAQEQVMVSQDEVLQKIARGNLRLKVSEKDFESARADYRQSNALYLPAINASHTALTTTNPLMAFGSKLNQEQLTAADFNPALLNNPVKTNNYATRLEILQPVINMDGLMERQAAKARMMATELQTGRTKEYLQLQGYKAYMQLQMAYKAVDVLKKASETGQDNLRIVQQYYKQGILQKTDLLAVEVRVNEIANQLQYAKSNVRNASDYLSFLMEGSIEDKIYRPDRELTRKADEALTELSFTGNRKDIMAMDKASEAYMKLFRSSRMKFLPRLNAFGSYELYDTRLFNMDAKGYTLGAQLSWSLFDGYKSIGKMEKAKADYQKASAEAEEYKAQSKLEWNQTKRQLQDAQNKVELTALAFEQSEEAYRIRQNRFEQGLEKTNELLMAESQMLQKEMELFQAIFEYNFTQKHLQFLTK